MLKSPGDAPSMLEEVGATNEKQLQTELKINPDLIPLEDLGLAGPALVIGRESSLESGRVDLLLLGLGGKLILVEFKTGPQNPDFRECLAQLLDYGSDLWRMTLAEFEARVVLPYFSGPHYQGKSPAPTSLGQAAEELWGSLEHDAIGWREGLEAQLRDGSFDFVAVAQKFTPSVLRTIEYMNETTKFSRFSAVEMIRFTGGDHEAFEARVIKAPQSLTATAAQAKAALAGVDGLTAGIADDAYRHAIEDLFADIVDIDGLTVFWGTTGCSLRVPLPGRGPLSIGWVFPPGIPRWLGMTDVTLGWYEDSSGLAVSDAVIAALQAYRASVQALPGASTPKSQMIHGATFGAAAVVANRTSLSEAILNVVNALLEA